MRRAEYRPVRSVPCGRKFNVLWALFGNEDDGADASNSAAGAAQWRPELTGWRRRLAWWLRNPFHNLTFYVIGRADKANVAFGRFPDTVFHPAAGWNVAVTFPVNPTDRWLGLLAVLILAFAAWVLPLWAPLLVAVALIELLPLPFVSWRGTGPRPWQVYAGWRPPQGSLGFKFRRAE